MNIAICDNELPFRKNLINKLNNIFKYSKTISCFYEFSNSSDFLKSSIDFDLIFIECKSGNINGIETISKFKTLKKNNNFVIFISRFGELVFESFKVKPHRFLLKPLEDTKLKEAVSSALSELNNNNKLVVKEIDQPFKSVVSENDIVFALADNMHTKIFTLNNVYQYSHTISNLERELKGICFFRTHRSYIVNMNYILNISNKIITMKTDEKVIISKKRYKNFENHYFSYINCGK